MQNLSDFMDAYEQANNSHVFANVEPFIAKDATYWFTDGSYSGIEEIRQAIQATFDKIQNEVYKIHDVKWVIEEKDKAVCTYRFSWSGIVNDESRSGSGRGTNVLDNHNGSWQIVHEHLSA